MMAALDLAAELVRHRLLAVTNTEHRHAGLIDRRRCSRRVLVEHRGWPAGKDDPFRPQAVQRLLGLLEGHDLAVHAFLAHPAGDQFGDLRAEVDNEDRVVHSDMCGCHRAGSRPLPLLPHFAQVLRMTAT
jgi:hypothetical protein